MRTIFLAAIGLPLLLLTACSPTARLPDLRAIYNQATEANDANGLRRPLITIPGTLGSRLVDRKSGKVIWGGGGSSGLIFIESSGLSHRFFGTQRSRSTQRINE